MCLEKSRLHKVCPSDIHNPQVSTGLQTFTFCLPSGGVIFPLSYMSKRLLPLSTNLQPSLLSCYTDKMEAASKDSHHYIHACCHETAAHSPVLTYLHGPFILSIQANNFNTSLPLTLIDYSCSTPLDYSNWHLSMLLFLSLKKKSVAKTVFLLAPLLPPALSSNSFFPLKQSSLPPVSLTPVRSG